MNKGKLLWLVFLFSSCLESEETFLKFVEVTADLEPAALDLASPNTGHSFMVKINSDDRIFGVGNAKQFYTDDLFKSVHSSSGFDFNTYSIDGKNSQKLIYNSEADELKIMESNDAGVSYKIKATFDKVQNGNYIYVVENLNLSWLVLGNYGPKKVIKIEGSMVNIVSTVPIREYPNSFWMSDGTGFISEEDNEKGILRIYRTDDEGVTWELNSVINFEKNDINTPYRIKEVRGYGNLIFGYATYNGSSRFNLGGYIYISRDNGVSWEFLSENNLIGFTFIDEMTGYAIKSTYYAYESYWDKIASTGYLYKTTDGGVTWQQVSNQEIYGDKLFFRDSNVGLSMSHSVLQITRDGGRSWKLLLFPIKDY